MKTLIFIISLLLLVILTLGSVPFVPYIFYKKVIDEGYQSRFIAIKIEKKELLKGKEKNFRKIEEKKLEYNKSKWEKFHLKNFIVPFPIFHPIYNLIPVVVKEKKVYQPGAKFVNNKGVFFGQFSLGEVIPLNRPFKKQELYRLPIFKNYLLKISDKKIAKDIFSEDINPFRGKTFSLNTINKILEGNMYKYVYNLFMLEIRKEIIGNKFEDFYYNKNSKIGVVVLPKKEDSRIRRVKVFIFNRGQFHTVYINYDEKTKEGKNLKLRIVDALRYKPTNEKMAKVIYKKFKDLTFRDQISSKGTVYLFSAWSHLLKNKGFVREMIQFLERSKRNNLVLQELYRYSFKEFGTTFSRREEFLKETQMLKLKRKMEKEESEFIKREKERKVILPEEKFVNKEEKIQNYLEEAKNEGSDLDEEDESLIVE